jgi:hypothetical protein
MSNLESISRRLIAIASTPPENRNSSLLLLSSQLESMSDEKIVQEQRNLIKDIIDGLIAENDADQIAKSKLVFVEDVEEQIAPTKKTRVKKVVTPTAQVESEDLPDFIEKLTLVKDLPEPVKKLIGLRRMQQGTTLTIEFEDTIIQVLDWADTPEGYGFWEKITQTGDLRDFKAMFGNKGEKVDELIEFAELSEFVENEFLNPEESTPAPVVAPVVVPVVTKQKLLFLRLIFNPPVGSAIKFEVYNPEELHYIVIGILNKLDVRSLTFPFEAVTDFSISLTNQKLYYHNEPNDMVDELIETFDTFVTPELDWSDFYNAKTDKDRIESNNEILFYALQPAKVVTPKPTKVVTPKPVVVEKPKPVVVEKPKPVKVEKPKPVKVATPKPIKQTKSKVEDDLSFLNDLDNIF